MQSLSRRYLPRFREAVAEVSEDLPGRPFENPKTLRRCFVGSSQGHKAIEESLPRHESDDGLSFLLGLVMGFRSCRFATERMARRSFFVLSLSLSLSPFFQGE